MSRSSASVKKSKKVASLQNVAKIYRRKAVLKRERAREDHATILDAMAVKALRHADHLNSMGTDEFEFHHVSASVAR